MGMMTQQRRRAARGAGLTLAITALQVAVVAAGTAVASDFWKSGPQLPAAAAATAAATKQEDSTPGFLWKKLFWELGVG